MTATTAPAAAALTQDRLTRLAEVFADAIYAREPSGDCTACDPDTGVLCGDHRADLDKAQDYADFAVELGIELET